MAVVQNPSFEVVEPLAGVVAGLVGNSFRGENRIAVRGRPQLNARDLDLCLLPPLLDRTCRQTGAQFATVP